VNLDLDPSAREVVVDGWPYFDAITEPAQAPSVGADGTSS
jgi:hypothetical protein